MFPDIPGDITGEVWFYKPDDNTKDFKLPVVADGQRTFIIDTGKLVPGLWRLKVKWQAADTGYYQEKELYL